MSFHMRVSLAVHAALASPVAVVERNKPVVSEKLGVAFAPVRDEKLVALAQVLLCIESHPPPGIPVGLQTRRVMVRHVGSRSKRVHGDVLSMCSQSSVEVSLAPCPRHDYAHCPGKLLVREDFGGEELGILEEEDGEELHVVQVHHIPPRLHQRIKLDSLLDRELLFELRSSLLGVEHGQWHVLGERAEVWPPEGAPVLRLQEQEDSKTADGVMELNGFVVDLPKDVMMFDFAHG
mmetsp:Transcript_15418/g.35332  ORF Transcript_15418/g.35332 Transcript_15418/m.35332 type:complete len:235 (-) Transcript_15418:551-1255(-)